jgi:hypothetical protein
MMRVGAKDDGWTLAAAGIAAACLASIAHEAVGHGGACLAVGGKVTLLTATRFACNQGNILVDLAGPLMNLISAAVALALLRTGWGALPAARLFLIMVGALNLCWFAGEMVAAPFADGYDQATIARQLGWSPVWKPVSAALGVAFYAATIAYLAVQWRQQIVLGDTPGQLRLRFGIAYSAATVSFLLAGASWARNPRYGALEAFLTIGVAAAPLWLSLGLRAPPGHQATPAEASNVRRDGLSFALLCFPASCLPRARDRIRRVDAWTH